MWLLAFAAAAIFPLPFVQKFAGQCIGKHNTNHSTNHSWTPQILPWQPAADEASKLGM
jgi:hypothetical protein